MPVYLHQRKTIIRDSTGRKIEPGDYVFVRMGKLPSYHGWVTKVLKNGVVAMVDEEYKTRSAYAGQCRVAKPTRKAQLRRERAMMLLHAATRRR